jgi:nucleoid DNA-binding protein
MFDTLMAIVKDHLLNEREVELKSLGKFYYLDKAPQVSNMTGGMIPAQKQLKFRVADRLARVIRVNSRED